MVERKIYTLIFIKNGEQVLLGHKTRGYGAHYWNGFGGKVENGESVLECAQRELKEECNLEADLIHTGVLYHNLHNGILEIIHVFVSLNYWGNVKESEEMNPILWYSFKDIPYDNMWPYSVNWYPVMLTNQYFSVSFEKTGESYTSRVKTYSSQKDFLQFLETKNLQ